MLDTAALPPDETGGMRQEAAESAPRHCGSDGGKCSPISPAPIAPRMASVSACSPTSASECPIKPTIMRTLTPHSINMVAGAEPVHIEAGADPRLALSKASARPLEVVHRGDLEVLLAP